MSHGWVTPRITVQLEAAAYSARGVDAIRLVKVYRSHGMDKSLTKCMNADELLNRPKTAHSLNDPADTICTSRCTADISADYDESTVFTLSGFRH